jgi:hypothetical protein
MRPTDYAHLISYAALAISNEWQPACANALSRRVRLLSPGLAVDRPGWPLVRAGGGLPADPCPPAGFEAAC